MSNPESSLPPGFRFHPTDEELILDYLRNKANAASTRYPLSIIAEVDIYKFDPWELPAKAVFGEKEWYFFTPRDRKYPNGARPNRAASSGYWKATGTDKPIMESKGGKKNIGVKKALVFYKGRPPKGIKTNWIMHEFRLAETPNNKPLKLKDSSMRLDDWVLCRIYKKSNSLPTISTTAQEQEDNLMQDTPLPALSNHPNQNTLKPQKSTSFSDLFDALDYSNLTRFLSDNPSDAFSFEPCPPILNYGNPDQSMFNNYCTKHNNNNNNSYFLQRLPQMDSSVFAMENQLKRPHSMGINTEESMLHPSKKLINSCSFINNSTTNQLDTPQYHLLNQQLILSSHLQF